MAQSAAEMMQTAGFLTIVRENHGYAGGYLVTNIWGRPLEFRLSTAVQPNRIQQILFGSTLEPYICADLIGKTLVDRTATATQCIFTDCAPVLDLRYRIDVPVACLPVDGTRFHDPSTNPVENWQPGTGNMKGQIICHPRFPSDAAAVHALLDRLDGSLDLAEPFIRIREAMSEAHKLGVMSRN